MKALTKEHLIEAINANYKDGEIIDVQDIARQINRLGDEWYIVDGKWELVEKADVKWSDNQ